MMRHHAETRTIAGVTITSERSRAGGWVVVASLGAWELRATYAGGRRAQAEADAARELRALIAREADRIAP